MLQKKLNRLFGYSRPRLPLRETLVPISDAALPDRLIFPLLSCDGESPEPTVLKGDDLHPGMALCPADGVVVPRSPVKGKVVAVMSAPGARGARAMQAALVEPAADTDARALEPLDAETAPVVDLVERLGMAGVHAATFPPRPLVKLIGPDSGGSVSRLVILAADGEPEVCSALQVHEERKDDILAAARLLTRIVSPEKTVVALPEHLAASSSFGEGEIGILPLPNVYPETLIPVVAARAAAEDGGSADGGDTVRVVPLETAIAALDAVREGRVQDRKIVTVIGPDGTAVGNLRVPIGMRLKDLLAAAGLEPGEKDKVVLGGPMRGFAQYSLESAVDAGVDAVTLVPAKSIVPWSNEPCINCGNCIDACPVDLQVHAIGRYSEFGLFDRTEECDIDQCIECGLCAMVCTARRPLLQLIRLAMTENTKRKEETEAARREAEAAEMIAETTAESAAGTAAGSEEPTGTGKETDRETATPEE